MNTTPKHNEIERILELKFESDKAQHPQPLRAEHILHLAAVRRERRLASGTLSLFGNRLELRPIYAFALLLLFCALNVWSLVQATPQPTQTRVLSSSVSDVVREYHLGADEFSPLSYKPHAKH